MDSEEASTHKSADQKSEDVDALLKLALSLDKADHYEEMLEAAADVRAT